MTMPFTNPDQFHWLWLAAAIAAAGIVAATLRRRAMRRYATINLWPHIVPAVTRAHRLRALLPIAGLLLLVCALADPRWGRADNIVADVDLEVMIVLDVSRSMLADDAHPSRLELAKRQIADLLDALPSSRAGLVVFGGSAVQLVPLTTSGDEIVQRLDDIAPESAPRGGSRLGDAIAHAADGFLKDSPAVKLMFLFSDGDDMGSNPLEAAATAHRDADVRIVAIGYGDADDGARIPVRQTPEGPIYLEHEGQQVWTRMEASLLAQIAQQTGGTFIAAGSGPFDMEAAVAEIIEQVDPTSSTSASREVAAYVPRYRWFLAAALFCLLADCLFASRRNAIAGTVPI